MSGSISKGFHRTGIVVALLIFAFCTIALALQSNGVSVWHWIVMLIASLFIYVVIRLIGWIVNGFIGG